MYMLGSAGILNERSPVSRIFYCHFTTVIVSTKPSNSIMKECSNYFQDTKSTKYILTNRMFTDRHRFKLIVSDKNLQ